MSPFFSPQIRVAPILVTSSVSMELNAISVAEHPSYLSHSRFSFIRSASVIKGGACRMREMLLRRNVMKIAKICTEICRRILALHRKRASGN